MILAELPGVKPDEVQVEIDRKGLTIQDKRKFETEERVGDTHRVERSIKKFASAALVSGDAAVPQGEIARTAFGDGAIVRDDQHRGAQAFVQIVDEA